MEDEPRKDTSAPVTALSPQRLNPASPEGSATTTGKSTEDGPAVAAQQPETTPLTKEEQWALFEKELKENDWGHQPC